MPSLSLPLLLLVAADPTELATRAAVLEAGRDERIEVVSQLDVADLADYEAQRQLCGADGESCMAQLAGAFDARFVLFMRAYRVGATTRIAFVLRDVAGNNAVLHRGDVGAATDDKLFAAVRSETLVALAKLPNVSNVDGKPRLFVATAVRDTDAAAEVTAPSTAVDDGISAKVWAGGAVAVSGACVAIIGGALWADDYAVITTPERGDFRAKQDASNRYALLDPALVVTGAVIAVAGSALLVVGVLE